VRSRTRRRGKRCGARGDAEKAEPSTVHAAAAVEPGRRSCRVHSSSLELQGGAHSPGTGGGPSARCVRRRGRFAGPSVARHSSIGEIRDLRLVPASGTANRAGAPGGRSDFPRRGTARLAVAGDRLPWRGQRCSGRPRWSVGAWIHRPGPHTRGVAGSLTQTASEACTSWRCEFCEPVGFQNSAVGVDLRFQAARSYSLIRPPRIGRHLIRCWSRSGAG
jgi:hypothetical protein